MAKQRELNAALLRQTGAFVAHRLRISMRVFFVLLTIGCVWLGLVVRRANEQRRAVHWVRENGGSVAYDYNEQRTEPPGPKWARELLGVDYFATAVAASLNYTQVRDVTPLASLKKLRFVLLTGTYVSNLAPLRQLAELETLQLDFTEVRDVRPLVRLRRLRYLNLTGTGVSRGDVQSLGRALPNCRIESSR